MGMYVVALLLALRLSPSLGTECTAQCLRCAQRVSQLDVPLSVLACTSECEDELSSDAELQKCQQVLELAASSVMVNDRNNVDQTMPDMDDLQDAFAGPIIKRYGGFIKKIDKNKIFSPVPNENVYLKGAVKKYRNYMRKPGERDVQSPEQGSEQIGSWGDGMGGSHGIRGAPGVHEAKRYGGFLRKFGGRRTSDVEEEDSQEDLQKRYGGFMRRIRPKLRFDNQKRYGGFLRRHFKISTRSDEEPSDYESLGK